MSVSVMFYLMYSYVHIILSLVKVAGHLFARFIVLSPLVLCIFVIIRLGFRKGFQLRLYQFLVMV